VSVRGGAASARFRAPRLALVAGCLAFSFAVVALITLPLILTACDAEFLADAPAEICTEVGSQCVLTSGPLGVCERSTCDPGGSEACFACVSQH
jgi:hypothetical protein